MQRKNRYVGVLTARQLGPPRGEDPVLLLYDIEDDRIRGRVSQICLDYGLGRIQFSAFFGRLTRNRRQQLAGSILNEVTKENVRVKLIPMSEENLADSWEYDYWRKNADELDGRDGAEDPLPRIQFVPDLED